MRHSISLSSTSSRRTKNWPAFSNSTARLLLELSYPVDATAAEIEAIHASLSSNASTSELLSFAERLPPLSRATFQAHIAAERPAECAPLRALINSHACIDPISAFDILKRLRTAGGNPAPSLASVTEGLRQLLKLHSETVVASLTAGGNTVEALVACTQQVLDLGERHQTDVLAYLLTAYHQLTCQLRAERLEEIRRACHALAARPEPAARQELTA